MMNTQSNVKDKNAIITACTGQVRAKARTFGIMAPKSDSMSADESAISHPWR